MTLLARLRQDLPADWQSPGGEGSAWRDDPIRTVYLTIGDRRLFVSARAEGGIVGEEGSAMRVVSWKALRRSICEGVARLALDHARRGIALPAVPPWALPALSTGKSYRLHTLAEREAKLRAALAAIEAERDLITTETL